MSATEVIEQIKSLPEAQREVVFEFVLREHKSDWMNPKPAGFFADCYSEEEIEISNWFADQGPKTVIP